MLSQKGDTAVYLIYSYVRISSILRKCGFSEEELSKESFDFTDDYEIFLASQLVKFAETIEGVTSQLKLNMLCKYLYDLSCLVAKGYKKYKINNNEHTKKRAVLLLAIKKMMGQCFFLLGMKTLEKI